jgi:hypothetical protein
LALGGLLMLPGAVWSQDQSATPPAGVSAQLRGPVKKLRKTFDKVLGNRDDYAKFFLKWRKSMKSTTRFQAGWVRRRLQDGGRAVLALGGLLMLPGAVWSQDQSATPPAGVSAQPAPGAAGVSAPPAEPDFSTNAIQLPKSRRNQLSFSGDYSMEQGTVSLPVGYSLNAALNGVSKPQELVDSAKRSSDYYGATLSYSHGQAWFFDLSYAQGKSTGSQGIEFGDLGGGTGQFTLDDDWYQAYVRYAFPKLRGKRLSAYVRLGATYVDSTMNFNGTSPYGLYTQSDKTTDIYGNLGLGATYSFFTRGRFSLGVQGEIEGLGGERSQDSLETLNKDSGLTPETAHLDNTVYGGLGKATLHLEYRLGKSGLCRLFLDGGYQYQYLEVSYPGSGDQNESLYGPYVKLGLRYSF